MSVNDEQAASTRNTMNRKKTTMKLALRVIAAGAAAAACIAAVVTVAHAEETRNERAADLVPSIVEDFKYPNADKIEEERGIVLKRGDGHITLTECSSDESLMVVYSRANGLVCFRVTGKTGYLSLEIPAVYGIKGSASHETDITLTAVDDEQNVALAKNEWKGVGQATDPQGRDHTLIELSTSA
ncbi:hypothetical protein ACIQU8_00705 [Streptomyces griseus]|uniref:hypothetical protein n=1 Tax=Streptomyces griseus TaxID=1911 RepID=UPI0037FE9000